MGHLVLKCRTFFWEIIFFTLSWAYCPNPRFPRDPGSPFENGFREPKYLSFRRWLYTPIIIWEGDWILRDYINMYLYIYSLSSWKPKDPPATMPRLLPENPGPPSPHIKGCYFLAGWKALNFPMSSLDIRPNLLLLKWSKQRIATGNRWWFALVYS